MSKKNIVQVLLIIGLIAAAWNYYQSRQPRFQAGQPAPAITFPMTTGDSLSLGAPGVALVAKKILI